METVILEALMGQSVSKITADDEMIQFNCYAPGWQTPAQIVVMHHQQDCCESVYVEDIEGDLDDLLYTPITMAEEVTKREDSQTYESATWTFYKIGTCKGSVTIRWLGTSNGYYSESVSVDVYKRE